MGLLEDLTNLLGGSRTESDVAKDKQDAVDEAAKLDLALQAQLKDLNPMDLLGEKGSNLKEQVQGLLSVVSTLKTKLGVYQDALKDKQ